MSPRTGVESSAQLAPRHHDVSVPRNVSRVHDGNPRAKTLRLTVRLGGRDVDLELERNVTSSRPTIASRAVTHQATDAIIEASSSKTHTRRPRAGGRPHLVRTRAYRHVRKASEAVYLGHTPRASVDADEPPEHDPQRLFVLEPARLVPREHSSDARRDPLSMEVVTYLAPTHSSTEHAETDERFGGTIGNEEPPSEAVGSFRRGLRGSSSKPPPKTPPSFPRPLLTYRV